MVVKVCVGCGVEFTRLYNNQKYCSPECTERARIARLVAKGVQIGVHNKPPLHTGMKRSEETKEKMRLAKLGKPFSQQHKDNMATHGDARKGAKSAVYYAWSHIKQRCLNPNNPRFEDYGGRGITIYEPWVENYTLFRDYVDTLPKTPERYTLDRIDNDGNYEPNNLRWATPEEQAQNRRPRRFQKRSP